ncbi:probable ATP-dependent RNA helicase vasa-like isoform X1 [Cherax quadricarinatus]|uniref:probable ATP-dependent RNA helicase vasa-like isoform X1 n=1 Tax=Cherax quadricarinatus TaxID=27406 RepID=UPI00387EB2D0
MSAWGYDDDDKANYQGSGRVTSSNDDWEPTAWISQPDDKPHAGERGTTCYKCNGKGHFARDCPSAKETGGFNRQQQDLRKERGQDRVAGRGIGKACFKCGTEGHLSRDCPDAFGGGKPGAGFDGRGERIGGNARKAGCFKCGKDGHMAKDCLQAAPGKEDAKEKPRVPTYIPVDLDSDKLFEVKMGIGKHFHYYDDMPVKVTGDDPIPAAVASFADMGLHDVLNENLLRAGYTNPTPIQKYAVPILMNGRDLMACAQTGSGKTAAFLLPVINYVLENNIKRREHNGCAQPIGLVLGPTRELISQIYDEARKFSYGTDVTCVRIYGGAATIVQIHRLKENENPIIMATPGRLLDIVSKGKISFEKLKFLIFDEADRMLDMGFEQDMSSLTNHSTMPKVGERQTMMFSATYPDSVQSCARGFMDNYLFLVVGTIGAANKDVQQEIVQIDKFNKREKLVEYIQSLNAGEKILVFVERKLQADFIGAYLITQGINATTIHGDRYQEQREEALSAFRAGINTVLVATNVAARGLDIVGVDTVVNFDLPKTVDEYVHRIGRTGRVGNRGHALSFFDNERDAPLAKDLVKILDEAGQEVPEWLMTAAHRSEYSQTYYGTSRFPVQDIRSFDYSMKPEGKALMESCGGPAQSPKLLDDEIWDE